MKKAGLKSREKPKLPSVVINEGLRIKLLCRRGNCKGWAEFTPDEIVRHNPSPIFCPNCKGEFSSGMRTSVPSGDKVRIVAQILDAMAHGVYCPTFGMELVQGPLPEDKT